MKNLNQLKLNATIAALGACLALPTAFAADPKDKAAMAADKTANPIVARDTVPYSDRQQMKDWSNEKEKLESELKLGQSKDYYAKALADHGYQITSVNKDTKDDVEYEVVKGNHSYEVQLDFKDGKATKVDVATNLWRAKSTKAAMKGEKVAMADKYVKGNESYSDRPHMKGWTSQKDQLEKTLATGHDQGWYANQLKKMGYQVTSVNDRDKDHVEYEIVKGKDTYEVDIDFDNGKAKEVDVKGNMWQADATEKALEHGKR